MLIDLPSNDLTATIIGCGIAVHRELGPGLLESTYKPCLVYELQQAGLDTDVEVPVPVFYKGIRMDCGYRLDLLVNQQVVVEIKAVEQLAPVHTAQMVTYLRLSWERRRPSYEFQHARIEGRNSQNPEERSPSGS